MRALRPPSASAFHGVTLPFGGAKGAGLALLMDALAGAFTGAAFAGGVRGLYGDVAGAQDVGHLVLCARPDAFMPAGEFAARMEHLVAACKAQPRAAGVDEILMPGEPESRAAVARARDGIPLQASVVASLTAEAARHAGLAFPPPLEEGGGVAPG